MSNSKKRLLFVLINFKTWESFREGFKVRYVNSKWVEVRTRNSNQTIGRVIDLESPQKVTKLQSSQILYILLINFTVMFPCSLGTDQDQRELKPNPTSPTI